MIYKLVSAGGSELSNMKTLYLHNSKRMRKINVVVKDTKVDIKMWKKEETPPHPFLYIDSNIARTHLHIWHITYPPY